MNKNLKDCIGREEFCDDVIDEFRIKQALSFINTKINNYDDTSSLGSLSISTSDNMVGGNFHIKDDDTETSTEESAMYYLPPEGQTLLPEKIGLT